MDRTDKKRVVAITGGAKGIGKAIAEAYGSKGYRVIILGRDHDARERTCREFKLKGYDIWSLPLDVTDATDCHRAVDTMVSHHEAVDILILNAGISMRGTIEETTVDVARKIMDTNYFGNLHMVKAALAPIKASGGSIVFISSIMALRGLPFTSYYGASKAAVKILSESLRCELASTQVHIGIIHVAMTQNDPEKRVLSPDGSPIELRSRKRSATQASVARQVVRCTDKRISEMTLTFLGKFAYFLYRHAPRLAERITTNRASVTKFYR